MASRTFYLILIFSLTCSNAWSQIQGPNGSAAPSSQTATDSGKSLFPFVGQILGEVNVRAGQSENFEKLTTLKKGDEVIVLDKSFSWYKIEMPQSAASYVSSEYIRLLDGKTGEVMGNRLNVRAGKGVNHSVIGQLKEGDKVQILETMDQWYKIKPVKGAFAWVHKDFLKFKRKDVENYRKEIAAKNLVVKEEPKDIAKISVKKEGKKEPEADKLIVEKDGTVKLTGFLRLQKDQSKKDIQYILEVDKNTFYYIEGFKYIFDEFLGYKVTVEGKVNKEFPGKYIHPVISVRKIELVL